MKKYLLTATTLAVMAASPAMAGDVTVYGKANVSLQSMKIEDSTETPDEVIQDNWELYSNASRLGVKGDSEVNEKVKAIYQLEYETSFDDGDKDGQTFVQRNIFVGLTGELGTVMTGMHDSPVKMLGELVDVFNNYELADIKNTQKGENRVKNMVMYRSPKMSGVSVDVMFAPGEQDGGDAASHNEQDGPADQISASVSYMADFGLTVALGVDSDVDDRNLVRMIAGYDAERWGISGLLQKAEEVDRVGTEEQEGAIVAGYCKLGTWKLKAQLGATDIGEDGADDIRVSQAGLGVDYSLGKKTTVFGYVAMVREETDNLVDDYVKKNTFGIGLEQKF